MRTIPALGLSLAVLAAPAAAGAQLALAARLGVGAPLGSAESGTPLSDGASAQIPLALEATWEVRPGLALGAYGSWGYALPGAGLRDACDRVDAGCSAAAIRAGVQAIWSFAPGAARRPWAGAGAGYEWLSAGAGESRHVWRGWEWLFLQGGVDFRTGARTSLGPFLSVGLGRYEQETLRSGGDVAVLEVADEAVHGWIQVGIRGAVELGR
jgi:hypothetical protein